MGMSERYDRLAREREEYFTTTLENARHSERTKRTLERVQAWP
jgi:hypothetical protein